MLDRVRVCCVFLSLLRLPLYFYPLLPCHLDFLSPDVHYYPCLHRGFCLHLAKSPPPILAFLFSLCPRRSLLPFFIWSHFFLLPSLIPFSSY
ncbi:hypothetical protein B0H19DRAFT_1204072 [Mycena capillaripes]|nr:hypothetical protein B0H19DRAFT_1204072 [Mycena capillaripes]